MEIKDPSFRVLHTQIFLDNAPKVKHDDSAYTSAEVKVSQLDDESRKAGWQRDTLVLARDVANLGRLFEAEAKSDRAKKTARLLHCKAQNTIGSGIVNAYMTQNCNFVAGKQGELEVAMDKVGQTNIFWY